MPLSSRLERPLYNIFAFIYFVWVCRNLILCVYYLLDFSTFNHVLGCVRTDLITHCVIYIHKIILAFMSQLELPFYSISVG